MARAYSSLAMHSAHLSSIRPFVFQVSLLGLQLIVNQFEDWKQHRAGHGRVFVGLQEHQVEPLRRHIEAKKIETTMIHWGGPTLVIRDLDENELFFWLPQSQWAELAKQEA
jgi:hypothetical protein